MRLVPEDEAEGGAGEEERWLHTGSLVCPPCQQLCGAQFAAAGEECRPGVVPPVAHSYPAHQLACHAPAHLPALPLITILLASLA